MRIAQAVVALVGAGLLSACTFNADLGTGGPTSGPVDKPSGQATVRTDVDAPDQQVPLDTQPQSRRVTAAAQAGGLVKLTGQGAVSDVVVDPGEMRPDMTLVMENYQVPAQNDPVLMIAVDNVPEETSTRRQHLWRGLLQHIGWTHGNITTQTYDPGKYGGNVECFLASLAETGNVVCGWADENTAGVALIPNSDLATAASVFVAMRGDIEI